MLIPKKVKHRKWHKGRNRKRQVETRGINVTFGKFGLQATASFWMTSNHIEASRRAMTNHLKREGKLWVRVFPDKPVTKRPPEVTMGGGKGAVDRYVFPVRPGRILFELDGVSEDKARSAFKRASSKLPIKTKVIVKN